MKYNLLISFVFHNNHLTIIIKHITGKLKIKFVKCTCHSIVVNFDLIT